MRRLLLVLGFFSLLLQCSTSQYTVKLRLYKVLLWPEFNQNEWQAHVRADVFDSDRNYVEPSHEKTYTWFVKNRWDQTKFQEYLTVGNSPYAEPDGQVFLELLRPGVAPETGWEMFSLYCRVEIEGTFCFSDTIRVPDDGLGVGYVLTRKQILFDQLRESGESVGRVGYKHKGIMYYYPPKVFKAYTSEQDTFYAASGSQQILKATQNILQNPSEKYNRWSAQGSDIQDVVNHKSFTIIANTDLTAKLKAANNATIQTCVAEGGLVASSVEFKDPWLVDDNSDPLGPRNRGINAVFAPKSTPFYPLNDANTKGVFLGQNPDPNDQSKPYYSVRAVQPIYGTGLIWNFSYWTTSNASVASSTNLETAVVFNASNATVTANYNIVVKPQALDFVGREADYDGKILLTWSDHPSTNVTQYKIYRKVTPYGGQPGQPTLLATLNRGTTEYKDNAFYYSDEHTTNYIAYDVRCFHQPTGTYSDPRWWETFGSTWPMQAPGTGGFVSQ